LGLKGLYYRTGVIILLISLAAITHANAFQITEPDTSLTDSTPQKYGIINFDLEPDTAFLYLNNNFDTPITLTDGKSLNLPEGRYRMYVFGKDISDRIINLEVAEDEPHRLKLQYPKSEDASNNNSMYAAYKWNANLMVFSDDATTISVMGTNVESEGFLKVKLPSGVYRLRFIDLHGRVTDEFVEINSYELKTIERHFKPSKGNSIIGGFIPGASQLYKGEKKKAALAFTAFGISTGLAIHYKRRLGTKTKEFDEVLEQYRKANIEQNALALGDRLETMESSIQSVNRRRNIFRASAILFYVASFVDAFRPPEHGFAAKNRFNPYRDFTVDINTEFVEARVQINF